VKVAIDSGFSNKQQERLSGSSVYVLYLLQTPSYLVLLLRNAGKMPISAMCIPSGWQTGKLGNLLNQFARGARVFGTVCFYAWGSDLDFTKRPEKAAAQY